jgi:hypothetical protein
MKTIKLFDGVKVTTDNEIEKFPDMTVFDKCLTCTDDQRKDIIRELMCFHTLDLTKVVGKQFILDLYND